MNRFWSILFGFTLAITSMELVRFIGNLSTFYPNMNLTEACLIVATTLLFANLLHAKVRNKTQDTRGSILFPPGTEVVTPTRRPRPATRAKSPSRQPAKPKSETAQQPKPRTRRRETAPNPASSQPRTPNRRSPR